jgi:dienelactone hydrolase
MTGTLADYREEHITDGDITHALYWRGDGPAVVLMHELPGLTRETRELADRLVDAGFTAVMPLLFGEPGQEPAPLRSYVRLCVGREFHLFARCGDSPIVRWLRAVCRWAHELRGGPGVGVVGMCLTGNFAIMLMAEPGIIAPVSCQPSLPFLRPSSLGMTEAQLQAAKRAAMQGPQPGLLAYRFEGDRTCPRARFETLRRAFGEAVETHELPGGEHSVLTRDFVDKAGHPTREALDRVLGFLDRRLRGQLQGQAPSGSGSGAS